MIRIGSVREPLGHPVESITGEEREALLAGAAVLPGVGEVRDTGVSRPQGHEKGARI